MSNARHHVSRWAVTVALPALLTLLARCASDPSPPATHDSGATSPDASTGSADSGSLDRGARDDADAMVETDARPEPDADDILLADADAGPPAIDATVAPDAPADAGSALPPTVRAVLVELPTGALLDLTTKNAVLSVPAPVVVRIVVQASDSAAAAGALVVELLDGAGNPITAVSRTFSAGLWSLVAELPRGQSVSVRVRNPRGASTSSGVLSLPSAAQLLAGPWTRHLFASDLQPTATWTLGVTGAAWTEIHDDGFERAGTLEIDETASTLYERTSTNGPRDDSDPTTVEQARRGWLFVDDRLAAPDAFRRVSGSGAVEGTWQRSYQSFGPSGGDAGAVLQIREDVAELLSFSGSSWSLERSGTLTDTQGAGSTLDERLGGTFVVEVVGSYTGVSNIFLRRVVSERGGVAVTPEPETVENIAVVSEYLLVSPWSR